MVVPHFEITKWEKDIMDKIGEIHSIYSTQKLKKYYKDDKEKNLVLGDKTKKMLNELLSINREIIWINLKS